MCFIPRFGKFHVCVKIWKFSLFLDAKAFRDYVNEALDATLPDRESLWNFLRALDWLSSISLYADMLSAECFCHSVTKNIKNKCKTITQFLAQDRFTWFTLLSRNIILNMFTNIIQTQWWNDSPIQVYGTVYCLRRLFYMYVFHISCLTTKPLGEKECDHFICLF